MEVQRVVRIEKIIVNDTASPTGRRVIGFKTHYSNGAYVCSEILFNQRILRLWDAEEHLYEVKLDEQIEEIDIYHSQYGIQVSKSHSCFFVSSWIKGLYCCDLETGKIKWIFQLKHATKVVLYPDYILCAFQEIGLRKMTYEGEEIGRYAITTYNSFFVLEDVYVFIGPNRGAYNIVDVSSMSVYKKIRQSSFAKADDHLIILNAQGNMEQVLIGGFKNKQPFSQIVYIGQ